MKLWGKTTIWLEPGPEFDVIDADGTDGSARLQLLDPFLYDITVSNETQYSIYVRALGKPGGKANMTTGFYDPLTDSWWYSVVNVTLTRTKGQSKFSDKTVELTTITLANGTRLRLFDNEYYQYFWDYDYGLKLVQMRIYTIPQVVSTTSLLPLPLAFARIVDFLLFLPCLERCRADVRSIGLSGLASKLGDGLQQPNGVPVNSLSVR